MVFVQKFWKNLHIKSFDKEILYVKLPIRDGALMLVFRKGVMLMPTSSQAPGPPHPCQWNRGDNRNNRSEKNSWRKGAGSRANGIKAITHHLPQAGHCPAKFLSAGHLGIKTHISSNSFFYPSFCCWAWGYRVRNISLSQLSPFPVSWSNPGLLLRWDEEFSWEKAKALHWACSLQK